MNTNKPKMLPAITSSIGSYTERVEESSPRETLSLSSDEWEELSSSDSGISRFMVKDLENSREISENSSGISFYTSSESDLYESFSSGEFVTNPQQISEDWLKFKEIANAPCPGLSKFQLRVNYSFLSLDDTLTDLCLRHIIKNKKKYKKNYKVLPSDIRKFIKKTRSKDLDSTIKARKLARVYNLAKSESNATLNALILFYVANLLIDCAILKPVEDSEMFYELSYKLLNAIFSNGLNCSPLEEVDFFIENELLTGGIVPVPRPRQGEREDLPESTYNSILRFYKKLFLYVNPFKKVQVRFDTANAWSNKYRKQIANFQLPKDFFRWINLREVFIQNMLFDTFPKEIKYLKNLISFGVYFSGFKKGFSEIPGALFSLNNLEELSLVNNADISKKEDRTIELNGIPLNIIKLIKLKRLVLNIKFHPHKISRNLRKLKNLKEILVHTSQKTKQGRSRKLIHIDSKFTEELRNTKDGNYKAPLSSPMEAHAVLNKELNEW